MLGVGLPRLCATRDILEVIHAEPNLMPSQPADVIEELNRYVPQLVVEARDEAAGLLGYLVVDSTQNGRACGGLRCDLAVSPGQLKALARGMTLKYGFNGIRQGGAKAGIVADGEITQTEKMSLLRRFGELTASMLKTRLYISGPDMGISPTDIDVLNRAAGVRLPRVRRDKGLKSGFYTALGVMVAMEAAAEARGMALQGTTVAVEGFGSVGSALALLLVRNHGSRIVAVSTAFGAVYDPRGINVERLVALRVKSGNECILHYGEGDRIMPADLPLLDVDVLAPCAGQFTVTLENADAVKAKIVCPGANNPVSDAAERRLLERGIFSVPYFAANGGGVLGNKLEVLDVSDEFIEKLFRMKNFQRIKDLMVQAHESGESPRSLAEDYALRRVHHMHVEEPRRSVRSTLRRGALEAFNRGFLHPRMMRRFAAKYFELTMGRDPVL